MTKSIKLLTAFLTFILMSSFTYQPSIAFTGTYGVPESDPAKLTLTINADHTFFYQDFTNTHKKIDVKGTWTAKGKKVYLKDNDHGKKFHDVWTIIENGQVAKSHKGITFYRLCKID